MELQRQTIMLQRLRRKVDREGGYGLPHRLQSSVQITPIPVGIPYDPAPDGTYMTYMREATTKALAWIDAQLDHCEAELSKQ